MPNDNTFKHIVFYDGTCGFCDRTVQFILKRDKKKVFGFAPLQGKTAQRELKNLPDQFKTLDTIILIENYRTPNQIISVMSKAVFKILWILGGKWKLLGWLKWLPAFFFNPFYRLIAKYRKLIISTKACSLPKEKERFLP